MTSETMPYPEDLFEQTGTKRADWLFGTKNINEVSGFAVDNPVHQNRTLAPYLRRVKLEGTNQPYGWCMRREDALHVYKEAHPEPPKASNGTKPETVIMAREQPIVYGKDAEQILHAFWDNKKATEALTDEVKALRQDLKTFVRSLTGQEE